MTLITRQRLPFILTAALVVLAIVAVAAFLATGSSAPTTAPTPTRTAEGGSEFLPSTATPTPTRLGIETKPLITEPLPTSASALGTLVAGFPTDVISVPPGATVVSSAIATEGVRMQATVVATSTASDGDVQSYYQGIFTSLGLTAAAAPSAPGTTATTYSRGTDSIIVATSAESGGTRLSIFALFTAGKS